jgi:hypothetical protein
VTATSQSNAEVCRPDKLGNRAPVDLNGELTELHPRDDEIAAKFIDVVIRPNRWPAQSFWID